MPDGQRHTGSELHPPNIVITLCFYYTVFWWNCNWICLLFLTRHLLIGPVIFVNSGSGDGLLPTAPSHYLEQWWFSIVAIHPNICLLISAQSLLNVLKHWWNGQYFLQNMFKVFFPNALRYVHPDGFSKWWGACCKFNVWTSYSIVFLMHFLWYWTVIGYDLTLLSQFYEPPCSNLCLVAFSSLYFNGYWGGIGDSDSKV